MPKFIIRRIASNNSEGSRRHALDLNAYTATPEDASKDVSAKMERREKTVKDNAFILLYRIAGQLKVVLSNPQIGGRLGSWRNLRAGKWRIYALPLTRPERRT